MAAFVPNRRMARYFIDKLSCVVFAVAMLIVRLGEWPLFDEGYDERANNGRRRICVPHRRRLAELLIACPASNDILPAMLS